MVTMQQVADRANVSISTVSFVVNNTKPVTSQTRERVLEAIDTLGYRRNATARALATRRSHVIALLYPLMNRNLSTFVEASAAAAEAQGYHLMLWPVRPDNQAAEVTSLIKSGIADGVLLLEVQLDDERVLKLSEANAPFALIGRTRDNNGIDYVDIDFEQTTTDAVDHLAELGHTHIALVIENFDGTPLAGYGPPARAEQAFREAMSERGLDGHVFCIPRDPLSELAVTGQLIEQAPQTTAIIVMHDEASFGLVNGLRRRGVSIPRDLSMVAIAPSTALGLLIDPGLTTYDAPGGELGGRTAEALIARLEGREGPPTQILVPCKRHDGASVGPAPTGRSPLNAIDTAIDLNPT